MICALNTFILILYSVTFVVAADGKYLKLKYETNKNKKKHKVK